MSAATDYLMVDLKPGEWYFGGGNTRVRTLLGSCVSLTVWNARLQVGGMCHYMLPTRGGPGPSHGLDGRYADEVLELMIGAMRAAGTEPADYELKMFGGGNMFSQLPSTRNDSHVAKRNVEIGRELSRRHGFRIIAEHLGGTGHRTLMFDIWNGDAWLRYQHGSAQEPAGAAGLA